MRNLPLKMKANQMRKDGMKIMKYDRTYNISLFGSQLDFILRQLAVRDKDDITLIASRIIRQIDAQDEATSMDEE